MNINELLLRRQNDLHKQTLAKYMQVSVATLYRKIKDPDLFTVGELRTICKYFGLNQADIVELVCKE